MLTVTPRQIIKMEQTYLDFIITLLCLFITPILSKSDPWYPHNFNLNESHLSTVFYPVGGDAISKFQPQITEVINNVLPHGPEQQQQAAGELFQWFTLTAFRDSVRDSTADSWIVLGGAIPNSKPDLTHPFTKFAAGVMSCRFIPDHAAPYGFVLQSCAPLELQYVQSKSQGRADGGAGLLGMGLSSVQLTGGFDGAVLVYCDPLWRGKGLHAGGRCRVRLRTGGQWWSNLTRSELIEFCTSSDHSQPCGGGFSVDLLQIDALDQAELINHRLLPNIKMIVGLPFAQPTGEVHLIENVLRRSKDVRGTSASVHRVTSEYEMFGSKVTWTPEVNLKSNRKRQLSFAQLPETPDRARFDQWAQESLALITSRAEDRVSAYRHLGTGQGEFLFDIQPNKEHVSHFGSGFGQSMDTVIVPIDTGKSLTRSEYAILVGSPFESSTQKGPNFGRVYIVCPELVNLTDSLSYIDGPESQAFFGYSLTRLGDVDGDGIDDVAIGAPALHGPTELSGTDQVEAKRMGKVYIHRITAQCKLDPVPIQVLTAPDGEPGDGFGVALSRGIDVDSDGWPELFVTSLRSNKAPYVYTMPRRLRAQCHISVPPVFSLTPFKTGTTIPLTITVRLFDAHRNRWVEIPRGIVSRETRLHQIDPDVLWQQRHVSAVNSTLAVASPVDPSGDDADMFFASIVDGEMDPAKPRFILADNQISSISVSSDASLMYVRAGLKALYGAQTTDLVTIPLRVAYRSFLNAEICPTLHSDNELCRKNEQPLIDWSACTGEIKLVQHICVPAPACEADLELQAEQNHHQRQQQQQPKPDPQTVANYSSPVRQNSIPVVFGNPKDRQQIVQFRVTNRGPTKTTGVRIQMRVVGRIRSERPLGVRLSITQVKTSSAGSDQLGKNGWTVNIAENGVAALVSSKSQKWMYPMESIRIQVTLFVEGLTESVQLPEDQWDLEVTNRSSVITPSFTVRVYSATTDPGLGNNEFTIPYNLTYKPRVQIGAGVQPSTVIDNRKSPILINRDSAVQKVFSHEIGPKVDHTFLIENRGHTTLQNLTFALDLPVMTADGKLLLYLVDQVRRWSSHGSSTSTQWESMLPHIIGADGQKRGECTVPEEHLNQFNLMILDFKAKADRVKRSASGDPRGSRSRRDVTIERLEDPESEIESEFPLSTSVPASAVESAHSGNSAFQRTERGRIHLRCPPLTQQQQQQQQQQSQHRTSSDSLSNWHTCVEIRCDLDRLDKGDTVRLRWMGWLWADTFFKLHTPDVQLVSRLRLLHWGEPPETVKFYQHLARKQKDRTQIQSELVTVDQPEEMPSFEMKQSIIFRNIHPDVIHQVPWWPIVVGVVVGCLLLSALGSCCYCCGFFRRRKIPEQDERAKPHRSAQRSSSKDRLLSNNGHESNHGRPDVPSFLPAVQTRKDRTPIHWSRRYGKSHRKPMDQEEFLVQASPNLLYTEEPEPPSPKLPMNDYVVEPDWDPEQTVMDEEDFTETTERKSGPADSSECSRHVSSRSAHRLERPPSTPSTGSDRCVDTEQPDGSIEDVFRETDLNQVGVSDDAVATTHIDQDSVIQNEQQTDNPGTDTDTTTTSNNNNNGDDTPSM